MRNTLLIICMAVITMSCTTTPSPTPFREDPLIGKIVNAGTGRTIGFNELATDLQKFDVIYLSEKHDNPMHHAIQRRIIQHFIDKGRAPVIGFEFFAMADTPLLLNFIDSKAKGHPKEMDGKLEKAMRTKLGWDNQSDTMWSYYWDLLILARDNGLKAVGLDLTSVQKRRITRKGMDGITGIEAQQLFSTGLSNPVYETHMKSIFKSVHCGMDHGGMTAKLYGTWLARNDRMALSITQIHTDIATSAQVPDNTNGPVIVIMGNGHTEYGLGVIDRVAHINPEITQVNLGLTEIFREPVGLEAYLEPLDLEGFPPAPPADYLWFTQRTSYGDPCERFKASLQRMKRENMKREDVKKKPGN
ncbi:MAG TPA: hypothetical protein DHV36_16665 [Desulfobacteraceae bacterium]|nr:hypothetical protein [Desulfobacteraceae bacterium]|tara:strand:+ start:284 stop:1360 length:1077 start_codon:yes stop_codon:yes gene_type:complete